MYSTATEAKGDALPGLLSACWVAVPGIVALWLLAIYGLFRLFGGL